MYIISSCLLGTNCKYNGGNNHTDAVIDFSKRHSHFAACPETIGGLSVPRHPVEIRVINGQERAINDIGEDVTDAFNKGVDDLLAAANISALLRGEIIEGAILKAKSPSCGAGEIYDGTFTHTVISGDGFLAKRLREMGIPIYNEDWEGLWHL